MMRRNQSRASGAAVAAAAAGLVQQAETALVPVVAGAAADLPAAETFRSPLPPPLPDDDMPMRIYLVNDPASDTRCGGCCAGRTDLFYGNYANFLGGLFRNGDTLPFDRVFARYGVSADERGMCFTVPSARPARFTLQIYASCVSGQASLCLVSGTCPAAPPLLLPRNGRYSYDVVVRRTNDPLSFVVVNGELLLPSDDEINAQLTILPSYP